MKYKIVNGVKYLCDASGVIIKDASGADVAVPDEQATGMSEHKEGDAPADVEDADVKALSAYIKTLATAEAKEAVKALDMIGGFSKAVREEFAKTFAGEMAKGKEDMIDVKAITDGLKSVRGNAKKEFEFEVKSLSEFSSLTGTVIAPDRTDTEIIRAPLRMPMIEDIADVGGTASNKVTWVEVLSETGAPATTAELATFAEKDYTFGVYSADVLKVTVMTKHSNEILEDMPALVASVKTMLNEDMALKVEDKLFSGAGTAGEFNGIYTQATAFAAGTLVVATPNKIDVLRAALVQVATAGKGRFQPTAIMLNPIDAGLLDMTKDTNGAYVMPPFTSADRTVIKGVRIIESTLVTAGNFLVGDFRKLHIRNKRGLSIQVATENGTEFEKDIVTIRASRRLASYVKTNEAGAFVKGTFSTAITDLTS